MADHYSPMSITQLINTEEPRSPPDDVQLAAEALGHLASSKPVVVVPGEGGIGGGADLDDSGVGTNLKSNINNNITLPPLSVYSLPSTTSSSPLPTPSSCISDPPRFSFSSDVSSIPEEDHPLQQQQQQQQQQRTSLSPPPQQQQQPFIDRVSNIPLVNSALRVYEQSTAQNVMKYGTDMVGSFTGPIYDKFGKRPLSNTETQEHDEETMAAVNALARATLADDGDSLRRRTPGRLDDDNIRKARSRPHSRSTSPHRPYVKSATTQRHHHHHHHHHHNPLAHRSRSSKVNNQSRWQQIVMHAGSAAGTTAAVVSEESMKCLRYCLHWLQYATQHIQQQMHILRNYLVSLATSSSTTCTNNINNTTVSRSDQPSASTLADIQKEIILTLRKVVEVVSRYAGAGLPTHAKASVRSFILQLPSRWATLNTTSGDTADLHPSSSNDGGVPDHVKETSVKLLNFGGESVEMLDSVSTVFSDSIDRAEVWLDRLRVVGVAPPQHQQHQQVDCMEI
ncbi:transcription factor Opi1-domain-containing protein [Absidia repens]|uniref:Transcription factor Opi1-domain-containing protein n=1 Tax=Absidia repens TaxID=90262 RepID=A0A1X2IFA7_9FUNG|nr:transcription factor Opi1-domain-containing protein [Absidia repens]